MNPSPYLRSWSRVGSMRLPLSAIALSIILFCGCRNANRPKTVPVKGSITFGGQPPAYPGALFFAPLQVADGYPRRGGRAHFDTDGQFVVTSFDEGDGLVPGTYRVRIESWRKPPTMEAPGISYVPRDFNAADLVVAANERVVRYDVEVPNGK